MDLKRLTRRQLLQLGLLTGSASAVGMESAWAALCPNETYLTDIDLAMNMACGTGLDAIPYSPIIVKPFSDDNPLPLGTPGGARKALAPGYRRPDGTLAPANATDLWSVRQKWSGSTQPLGKSVPGPGIGDQDTFGDRPNGIGLPRAGTHQLYPGNSVRWDGKTNPVANYPAPILYHIRLQVAQHSLTKSPVLPIGLLKAGAVGAIALPSTVSGVAKNGTDPVLKSGLPTYVLPDSTIYGFNGQFPGPIINAEYGKPALVRFENDLDINPNCRSRYDFGSPDWAFLTHLHNGHTAPESDGNPHHLTENGGGYQPGQWSDNLYLGYAAGGDETEKQSFLWFHDHRMHHTGANVYKGMVGLMPHYDPILDSGDERFGLRLPGVRRANVDINNVPDGTFDVDYDVPMAFYDCAMDDAVTPHFDNHQSPVNCGSLHPEWWGQSFYRHYPKSGFVGDIFTVNGKAYPVLHVKPRRYRFRFLGASIARCYELSLRFAPNSDVGTGVTGVGVFPGLQGQWNFAAKSKNGVISRTAGTLAKTSDGKPAMLQIASDGGLLKNAIYRDAIQIWPAKRREVIIDFSDPALKGKTLYLVNSMLQLDGKKPTFAGVKGFDPNYAIPLIKICVDVPMNVGEVDNSDTLPKIAGKTLRNIPSKSGNIAATPQFVLNSNNALNTTGPYSAETQWVINGLEFDAKTPLHTVTEGQPEQWTIINNGGGWTHPLHIHQEEHQVIARAGSINPHPEDGPPAVGKEDVVALDPGETVTIYRNFRTFAGKFVAHCHNLAHEDHNMMFGWTIRPKP